jgi:hypothetical protein
VKPGRPREVDRRRGCGFNASFLVQEGRLRDETLVKDEVDATGSS